MMAFPGLASLGVAFMVTLGTIWTLLHWQLTPPSLTTLHVAPEASMEATVAATNLSFEIKHVFHAPTNPKLTVKRLDITDAYKQRHADAYFAHQSQILAQQRVLAFDNNMSLEQAYHDYDWPQAYAAHNPMTMKIPMKRQQQPNRALQLQRRHEPGFIDLYLAYARVHPKRARQIELEWVENDVVVPDITDRDTVIGMALIALNAYVRFPKDDDKKLDWRDVPGWDPDRDNEDLEFGWDDVGIRGHVFVLDDNSTVVIGIKGTLGAGLPGGGLDETGPNDKINDNLLFSCCCARVLYMWTTVCDCYDSTYTCNQDCLEKELQREDRYYRAVLDLYKNVTTMYPPEKYNYWLLGHLLGGALALLVGRTYGIPVVAYEAPGEMLPAQRLHLPQAPGLPELLENIWHIGNTADPIYMGVCNGALSLCNLAGYAMETACHTGKQCVYDVVNDLGWRVNMLNHRIHTVIDEILTVYNDTAPCYQQPPCRDCFNWKFILKDDDEDDEPYLPNPLRPKKPRPTHTQTHSRPLATSSSTGMSLLTTSSSKRPQKCLERNWYGWCLRWGDADDDEMLATAPATKLATALATAT